MVNKAIIIGNLGQDPEVRYTQSGAQVTTFSVATSETWRDQSGQKQTATEWHKIVAWKRLAEICGEYLRKGSKVYIEGKIQTRKYQDQQGNDRFATEIVAREVKLLDKRNQDQARDSSGQDQGYGSGDYGGGYPDPAEDVPF